MSRFHTDAATVPLTRGRPLLIADADEVLLGFARGFECFLETRGLVLDLSSYRLHGNVRRRDDGSAVIDIEVTGLLDEFRAGLDWLEPVEGAGDTLAALRDVVDVVVLSNVTRSQAPARLRNFTKLGWDLPLVINDGPKGGAVKTLARRAAALTFFIDDIPQHHASVAESAPQVLRIHLVGDARLKALLQPSPHADLWAEDWPQAGAFIRTRIAAG